MTRSSRFPKWVCLKIVYPYTQWLMITIPTKWLYLGVYPIFRHTQISGFTGKKTSANPGGVWEFWKVSQLQHGALDVGYRCTSARSARKCQESSPLRLVLANVSKAAQRVVVSAKFSMAASSWRGCILGNVGPGFINPQFTNRGNNFYSNLM